MEALTQATEKMFRGVPTHVMTAEHLAAIMLDVGRPKDFARLLQFVEADVLDKVRFTTILERHDLVGKWQRFNKRFLEEG